MSEPEILRPPGFVVYPGAKLVEASSDSPSRLVLGPGVRSVGHQVVASSVGRFHAKDKRFFWIGKHQRRYVPAKGDVVIGLIGRKIASGERCLVNYDSDSNGNIHFMAFEGATKKNKPELNDLDVIYARVLSCQSSDKVEFTCVDHLGKASGMGRLGNSDGTVLFLDTETCRRLLTTEASILDRIGRDIPLECAIGMNGRIWLRCKDLTCETAVTQIILRLQEEWNNTEPEVIIRQEVESLLTAIPVTKLADRQQERLVERVGSLIESKMAAGRWREVRKIDPSYFYWSSNGREWERMAYRPNPDCRYLPPTTRGLREMPNDPGFFLSGQPNKKKRTSQKLARELMTLAHLAYKEQIPDDLDVVNVTLRKKIEGSVVMVLVKFPDQAVIKVYKPACNKDGRLLQPPFYVKIEGRMTKVSRSPLTNDLKLDWKEDGKNVSIRVEKDGSWSVEREEETGKPAEKKSKKKRKKVQ